MKGRIKHIIVAVAVAIILAAGIFAGFQHRNKPCERIEVLYENTPADTLLYPERIIALANTAFDSIIGTTIKEIDVDSISSALITSPYIQDAYLSYGLSGTLKIYIVQEEIIARVINTAHQHRYLTLSGHYIPTGKVAVRVPVFSGYISPLSSDDSSYFKDIENPVYQDIYEFTTSLIQHPFMLALSEQIYVNRAKKFEVVPKLGIKNIIVGDCGNLEQRFNNLQLFYEQKLPFIERTTYKELNISIENQIIAKK